MSENKIKNHRLWLVIVAVLLVCALGGTGAGIFFYNKYNSIRSAIENAGGYEFVELIQRQHDTILTLQGDLGAIRDELESAIGHRDELRDRNRRAIEIALGTDERLEDFENTVDGSTNVIERIERRQQRIDNLITGIRSDNRRLRDALRGSYGAGD